MRAIAVVMREPERLALEHLALDAPGDHDVVVDIAWSGISTGTERLLWSGRMPHFPGMGYPLVPGYESVGRVSAAGAAAQDRIGEQVFVPGARCWGEVRGLFGGSASRVVVAADKVLPIGDEIGERGVLLALAATAHHAMAAERAAPPDLVVGHGVLGRLLARLAVAKGWAAPTVWERDGTRAEGAVGYTVLDPADDPRRDYRSIFDVSGDSAILDTLVARLAPGGEIVLAGFYSEPLAFAFAPAFMREARFRIAAQWQPSDLVAVRDLFADGRLLLDGLVTHREPASQAENAYRTAFGDARCLKMTLDWRACQ